MDHDEAERRIEIPASKVTFADVKTLPEPVVARIWAHHDAAGHPRPRFLEVPLAEVASGTFHIPATARIGLTATYHRDLEARIRKELQGAKVKGAIFVAPGRVRVAESDREKAEKALREIVKDGAVLYLWNESTRVCTRLGGRPKEDTAPAPKLARIYFIENKYRHLAELLKTDLDITTAVRWTGSLPRFTGYYTIPSQKTGEETEGVQALQYADATVYTMTVGVYNRLKAEGKALPGQTPPPREAESHRPHVPAAPLPPGENEAGTQEGVGVAGTPARGGDTTDRSTEALTGAEQEQVFHWVTMSGLVPTVEAKVTGILLEEGASLRESLGDETAMTEKVLLAKELLDRMTEINNDMSTAARNPPGETAEEATPQAGPPPATGTTGPAVSQ